MVTPFRIASAVTAINVLVMSGFSLAALANPQPALTFALYAAARTVPLAVAAGVAIYRRNPLAVLVLGALAGAIQVLDAGVGLVQEDLAKTAGPLVIAALQFAAVAHLARSMKAGRS